MAQVPFAINLVFMLTVIAAVGFIIFRFEKIKGITLPKYLILGLRIGLAAVLTVQFVLATGGYLNDFTSVPPPIGLVIVPMLILAISLPLLPVSNTYLKAMPAYTLIIFQAFRVPVEYVLHQLYTLNLVPHQMTFEGLNFDIHTGILSLFVGVMVYAEAKFYRTIWLGFNLFGLATLINIIVISVLSTPSPYRVFMNPPANTIIATFPYVWLPGFLVPFAMLLHVASLRQWWLSKKKS